MSNDRFYARSQTELFLYIFSEKISGQPHQNDKKLLWMDASKFLIVNALTGNHNLRALLPFFLLDDNPALRFAYAG